MSTVRKLNESALRGIYDAYMHEAFPPAELKPLAVMLRLMERGRYLCYGYYRNGRLAVRIAYPNADPATGGVHLERIGDLADQRHDVETLLLENRRPGLEFRYFLQIVDNVNQPVDILLRALEVLAVDRLVLDRAVKQRHDIALQREDRRLDLVRHVAQELLSVTLVLLEASDFAGILLGPAVQLVLNVADRIGFLRQLVRPDAFRQ